MVWGILVIVLGVLLCLSRVSPSRYFQGGTWGKPNLAKVMEQNYDMQKKFEKTPVKSGYTPSVFFLGIVLILIGIVILIAL
jgi:uncharacterized membrane protein HdeD (DUF308 family)